MSRMKLLLDVVNGLRSLADDIQTLADAMSGDEPAEPDRVETQTLPPEDETVTLADVRAALAEKSRMGYTAEVRNLILRHGADKLSEVEPAEYPALLAEAERLTDGG